MHMNGELLFAIHLSLNIFFECKSICARHLINKTAFLRISKLRLFFARTFAEEIEKLEYYSMMEYLINVSLRMNVKQ